MILSPTQGLGNRLENVFGFINTTREKGEKITLVWRNNGECSGSFCDCFLPIEGFEVTNTPCGPVDNVWSPLSVRQYVTMGNDLKLTPVVEKEVNEWKQRMGDYIAVHVRKTDFVTHVRRSYGMDVSHNDVYYAFIDSVPSNVFLATDNTTDQALFKERYGSRVFFNPISPSKNLRQTSFREAVVDMFVCAGAREFLGTRASSFSKTILALRKEVDKIFGPYYNQYYDRITNQECAEAPRT